MTPRKRTLKSLARTAGGPGGSQAEHSALVLACAETLSLAYGARAVIWRAFASHLNPFHCDIYACVDGRLFVFEIKTGRSKLNKRQREEMPAIRAAGGVAVEIRAIVDLHRVMAEQMPKPNLGVGL